MLWVCAYATRLIPPTHCCRVAAPDLWVPNKTIEFNFSTWLLQEELDAMDELGSNITQRDLYYEFRLIANTSAAQSAKSACSQFLGAYAPSTVGKKYELSFA